MEREQGQPWITHRVRRGSFFLTSGGAPYDCRWKAVTPEQFEALHVFIELPLIQRAFEEVFGADAGYSNPSHFAQIFRRENGLTPSEYRRQR